MKYYFIIIFISTIPTISSFLIYYKIFAIYVSLDNDIFFSTERIYIGYTDGLRWTFSIDCF